MFQAHTAQDASAGQSTREMVSGWREQVRLSSLGVLMHSVRTRRREFSSSQTRCMKIGRRASRCGRAATNTSGPQLWTRSVNENTLGTRCSRGCRQIHGAIDHNKGCTPKQMECRWFVSTEEDTWWNHSALVDVLSGRLGSEAKIRPMRRDLYYPVSYSRRLPIAGLNTGNVGPYRSPPTTSFARCSLAAVVAKLSSVPS